MYDTYTVLPGDTLESISSKLNISADILKELNNYDDIIPGMNILVPRNKNPYFNYYTVEKGDNLYQIATQNKIDPALLAELNGINPSDYIYPNQVLLIPKAGSILYITAVGDTLGEIAKGFKVDPEELIKQNNNIYLQEGQLLVYKYK